MTFSNVWKQFKLVFIAYIFIVVIYLVFFVWLRSQTIIFLDNNFSIKEGFGISFMASLFEDICFFGIIGIIALIIPTIISNKRPEELEFETRVKAIMNSGLVKGDQRVFSFLKQNILNLLAFNKTSHLEIIITNYYEEEQAYRIVTKRTQTVTNMCTDEDAIVKDAPIKIYTDYSVYNSYGQVLLLERVDPKNINTTLDPVITSEKNYQLKEGENTIDFLGDVSRNSEIAYKLSFCAFAKTADDKSDDKLWHYFRAILYCSKASFTVRNELDNKADIIVDSRRRNLKQSETTEIYSDKVLKYNTEHTENLVTSLFSGDSLEFFIKILLTPKVA